MKLILFTQKVDTNDTNLGFFTQWLKQIAKQCEGLTVVCWYYSGEFIASNTNVIGLRSKNKLTRIVEIYKLFIKYRKNYDKIFVHMLPEIVVLLAPIKFFYKKDIYLWYTHKSISSWLVLAEKIVKKIFSASLYSFNLKTNKLVVFGHGIITKEKVDYQTNSNKIITLGRISRVKKIETLLRAVKILIKDGYKLEYDIVGPCIYDDDKIYLNELKTFVAGNDLCDVVRFLPAVSHQDVPNIFKNYSMFIHQCEGGLDKAPLEAMANGLLVISSNKSVKENLIRIGEDFIFTEDDPVELAKKIKKILLLDKNSDLAYRKKMTDLIKNNHSLENLISKIMNEVGG